MPGITLATTFQNSGLPSAVSLADQIKGISSLLVWAQADPPFVDLDGSEILAFNDRAGGAGVFTAGGSTQRADLEPATIGPYSSARFYGADGPDDGAADRYALSGVTLAADVPFSFVGVFKRAPASAATVDCILGRWLNATTFASLQILGAMCQMRVGTTTAVERVNLEGQWSFAIGSFDGTNVKLNTNGVDATPQAKAGGTSSAVIRLGDLLGTGGGGFDGWIADAMVFSSDVLGNAGHKQLLMDYFKTVYGLPA